MARLVKIAKTLRNNWKKTVFGCSALSYGVSYGKGKYDGFQLMRTACEEALSYGSVPLAVGTPPRTITVLVNPAANRRKAKATFEEYCAPLLNLAGITVNVIYTDHEGQLRTFLEDFNEASSAIVVGGGDGTLSEAVTGLLRANQNARYPVAVLPLGRNNTVANSLFSDTDAVGLLVKATMAVIREVMKPVDVIKVEVLQEETETKPVFSLAGIRWGSFRDAQSKQDKYWYWGPLRLWATYFFSGYKGNDVISWDCKADMSYILPCTGCSTCYIKEAARPANQSGRWWHVFLPRKSNTLPVRDYSRVMNPECGVVHSEKITTVDIALTPSQSSIDIALGPTEIGFFSFVTEGWRRANGNAAHADRKLSAREVELWPVLSDERERFLSIDWEEYEVKPIRLTLMPNQLMMYCPPESIN